MGADAELLAALQHGDSFFPGGTVSFSWGLETSVAEGAVACAGDLSRFIEGQIRCRWASCDRPAIVASYRAKTLAHVARIDDELDALALPREMRDGGRRAGGALLDVHASLRTPKAARYRDLVRAGGAPGQLAIVQGLVWRGIGMSEEAAAAVSGHIVCVGFVGAAIRLGLIGHVDGQTMLSEMRAILAALLAEPAVPFEQVNAYVPAADIAMMRHEAGPVRMFAN